MNTRKHVKGLKLLSNNKLHSVWYIHDQSIKLDNGNTRLKSGISSKLTPRGYTSETIRNEGVGKVWVTWNDCYLHQSLSYCQAAAILPIMDKAFNSLMKENGYQSRMLHNDKTIGTEYFEYSDRDSLIEIIESTWDEAYKLAYEYVTRTELPNSLFIEEFTPRKYQDVEFIDKLVAYYIKSSKNQLANAKAPGGSGKTSCSYRISQIVCEYLEIPWKILTVSDNIANTVQLTSNYSNFYKGQKGKRNMNIYVVGSINPSDYRMVQSWANVISVSSTQKIKEMLIRCTTSKQDCAIFVVNKSMNSLLTQTDKLNINFKEFFTIMDEIQQYASENGTPKNVNSAHCAVVNPIFNHLFGKKLGLSATPIDRGGETSINASYNDDLDKFGPRIVDICGIKARSFGWICEKEVLINPVPRNHDFITSIKEKRPFELTLGKKTHSIHPSQFIVLENLRKYILPQGKTHILILASFIKDVKLIAEVFNNMKECGYLDSEYEIIEGYSKCGASCVNRFNMAKKSIMIATRWVGVGQDTYKCDCVIPMYNPNNEWFSRQVSMRGDRVYGEDKLSLLSFVEFEDKLEDNVWFRACENISNGHIPNIISDSAFREQLENNTIGSHVNPNEGTNVTTNVTVVRQIDHDPILFANWVDMTTAIATHKYTDKDGNSRFSKISKEVIEKKAEEFLLESFCL